MTFTITEIIALMFGSAVIGALASGGMDVPKDD